MTIAQVTQAPPPLTAVSLIPFFFLGTTLGGVMAFMARRKGRNPFLWFVLGFVPLFGFFAALVLASRPDIDLLKRIWALEDIIAKLNSPSQTPPIETGTDSRA